MEYVNDNEHGWVAYLPGTKNEHLLPAARDRVTRAHDEVQHRPGRLVARVVVEVYENREPVPQLQFPSEPPDEGTGTIECARLLTQCARLLWP